MEAHHEGQAMAKRVDWADKAAYLLWSKWSWYPGLEVRERSQLARSLRAAERRGFKRAVTKLREYVGPGADFFADWLEKQKP